MRMLLTAGGTREPIDAVRYLGNRSSGRMGAAVAAAALEHGHTVTAVVGQVSVALPEGATVERVETTRQMHDAVLGHWPDHDVLVMAAAVADFRPVRVTVAKLRREGGPQTLELEPTEDILAAAGAATRPGQVVVGFSLDEATDAARQRARQKLARKGCHLLVFNPLQTMDHPEVSAMLFWRDGREEVLEPSDKPTFARRLVTEIERLHAMNR